MLNLIDPRDIGKCVNLIYSYKKPLLKCIEEQLWIRHLQKWWAPYEFALEFGRSWILAIDEETQMKNPYDILYIDTGIKKSVDPQWEAFKSKVDAYYREGWDQRLKTSIETNRWV